VSSRGRRGKAVSIDFLIKEIGAGAIHLRLKIVRPDQSIDEEIAVGRNRVRTNEGRLGRRIERAAKDVSADDAATRLKKPGPPSQGEVPSPDIEFCHVVTELKTAERLVELTITRCAAAGNRTCPRNRQSGTDLGVGVQRQFASDPPDPEASAFRTRLGICGS